MDTLLLQKMSRVYGLSEKTKRKFIQTKTKWKFANSRLVILYCWYYFIIKLCKGFELLVVIHNMQKDEERAGTAGFLSYTISSLNFVFYFPVEIFGLLSMGFFAVSYPVVHHELCPWCCLSPAAFVPVCWGQPSELCYHHSIEPSSFIFFQGSLSPSPLPDWTSFLNE